LGAGGVLGERGFLGTAGVILEVWDGSPSGWGTLGGLLEV